MTRQRPAVVTAAVYLMFFVAVVSAVGGILAIPMISVAGDAVRDAAAESGTDQAVTDLMVTTATGALIVTVALSLTVAIAYVVLGLFVNRGANGARITTWVLTGLFLLCGLCGLGGNAIPTQNTGTAEGIPDQAEMEAAISQGIPDWYEALTIPINVVTYGAYAAIVILLALPAAHAYFRKEVAQWQPPADAVPPGPASQGAIPSTDPAAPGGWGDTSPPSSGPGGPPPPGTPPSPGN